ncbi:hypothetical protein NIES2101_13510 [Calothrix sp. HK-06]|nr:hypothetical protein NIES2101_13510 [Calothrix sp. HK-06]
MSRDAVVVGINTYTYPSLSPLTAPAEDAEVIAQLLEKYGDFKVKRLPAVKDKQSDTIRVGKKNKVRLTELEDAIVQLLKPEGKPPDTALLYFSGHGLRRSKGVQEGFLASSDVDSSEGKWGLPFQWLRRILQESEVQQQIIILDCCHAGEVINFQEADPGERGKGRDRCFMAASRSFEIAYEEINSNHSVFTAALIKALEPKSRQWVTNYTLAHLISQEQNAFPQRPIFSNSGEPINLTRSWELEKKDSIVIGERICPYKGLNYFDCTEEDARYFYGRTVLTDEVLEKLRVGNFLAVLGASGSGKSSLVRAGLLYQLKLGQRLSGSESWHIKIFQPDEHPLYSLASAFLDSELSDTKLAIQLAQEAEKLEKSGSERLRQLINVLDTQRVVLVIDQFEEVFTLCKDTQKRQQFFECLLGALAKTENKLCLVLTMRADFFGKCTEQEYSGLAQQIQHNLVPVTPMSPEELRQAIVQPVKQVEVEIEPELVEQILTDVVNAPGYLPLLQYTLTEVWKQSTGNCLQLNTYVNLGRVVGTLSQRGTKVYESFSQQEQAAAQHIFLALVQLGEGTEDTRRRVLKQDLVNQNYSEELINTVVWQLADEKLVITDEIVSNIEVSKRVEVIDVAHEALIRHWTLLRQWIEENRERLRKKREIIAMLKQLRERTGIIFLQGFNFSGLDLSDINLSDANLICANFSDTNLSGADLSGANLIGVKLCRANLSGANLSRFNFRDANFSHADLSSADLSHAILRDTDFESANLSGADLGSSNLSGANLSGANLSGANLSHADLSGPNPSRANLSRANLSHADLSYADLSDTNLNGANLSHADLSHADLSGTNLSGANLNGAKLNGAKLIDANLNGAKLIDANLIDANFSGSNLSNTNLKGANLSGVNLSGVIIDEATKINNEWRLMWEIVNQPSKGRNLIGAKLRRVNLINVNLIDAKLSRADLIDANLSRADLSNADLNGAKLSNANLSGAKLSGAKLSGAKLSGVNLSDAILSGADLSGAILINADLSGVILNSAKLSGAKLSGAKLSGADLGSADLGSADLSGAILNRANLSRANLSHANLSGTNLNGAILSGAILSGANLSRAKLSHANLSYADLSDTNLSDAKLIDANLSGAILNGTNLGRANLSCANLIDADLSGAILNGAKF